MTLPFPSPPSPRPPLSIQGIGLCVAVSLGAHGLLLGMPLSLGAGQEQVPPQAEDPLDPIEVAVLPVPVTPPEPVIPDPVAPVPVAPVPVAPVPVAPVPVAPRPGAEGPPPVSPAPLPAPAAAAPEVPIPEVPIPEVAATPPEPLAPEPDPLVEEPPPPDDPAPFANFPHMPGAQPTDCGIGPCWSSPVEGGWRSAAQSLQARLEAEGYTLANITGEVLSTETGVRIYRVAKVGEDPYYLNLVSVADGILYSLTPTPLSEDRLVALQLL